MKCAPRNLTGVSRCCVFLSNVNLQAHPNSNPTHPLLLSVKPDRMPGTFQPNLNSYLRARWPTQPPRHPPLPPSSGGPSSHILGQVKSYFRAAAADLSQWRLRDRCFSDLELLPMYPSFFKHPALRHVELRVCSVRW